MTDTPTTSENIIASANAPTDPKALSNAAVTEEPAAASAASSAVPSTDADLAIRVAALEADIAFLRETFGWPQR